MYGTNTGILKKVYVFKIKFVSEWVIWPEMNSGFEDVNGTHICVSMQCQIYFYGRWRFKMWPAVS